jgi:hypothetical protein
MGSESVKVITTRDSRQACMEQLLNDLEALEYLWKHQLFESDVQRIGVEQELCFVDEKWRPAMVEMEVLDKLEEENYTTEYAQFNMEINLDPQLFSGSCLSDMERQLMYFLEKGEKAANEVGAHLILTGILPSIRQTDLGHHSMTPLPRYKALTDMLAEMRGGPFEYRIEGTDQLIAKDDTALFESSNTSFQIHYQTPQHDFVDAYNWAQLITAPVLAAATNSPLFLGKRLWRETRIALFQQSVDTRNQVEMTRERSPRVFFGNDGYANRSRIFSKRTWPATAYCCSPLKRRTHWRWPSREKHLNYTPLMYSMVPPICGTAHVMASPTENLTCGSKTEYCRQGLVWSMKSPTLPSGSG